MTAGTPGPLTADVEHPAGRRRRDAAATRRALLDAACRRFADDGFDASSVRDIAEDAGVNVALIHRYFGSKEGLFQACLAAAVEELGRTTGAVSSVDQIPGAVAQAVGATAQGRARTLLPLLLRSSGNEQTERVRADLLRSFGERLAGVAGWRADDPDGHPLLLRAELVLAVAVGVTVLRASARVEPLASASDRDLVGPLRAVVEALLGSRRSDP